MGEPKKQISKIQKTQKQNNREKLCKKRTVKKGNKNGKNGLVHLHFCLQLFFFLDLFFLAFKFKIIKIRKITEEHKPKPNDDISLFRAAQAANPSRPNCQRSSDQESYSDLPRLPNYILTKTIDTRSKVSNHNSQSITVLHSSANCFAGRIAKVSLWARHSTWNIGKSSVFNSAT